MRSIGKKDFEGFKNNALSSEAIIAQKGEGGRWVFCRSDEIAPQVTGKTYWLDPSGHTHAHATPRTHARTSTRHFGRVPSWGQDARTPPLPNCPQRQPYAGLA
ncbi:hypothetical protein AAG570_011646 [Ranatra chinensis]|uniref:Uncharacterized protein n=1 Tax=Ranatra chinensis TaxID=642074 RepID=A0ABD0Z7H0_9HEMI